VKSFLAKPFRLPRLRPYVPEPGDPAIFWFNSERDDVVREVARRVVERRTGDRKQMEYALNEIAFHESERLKSQRDTETAETLGYWKSILRRVARMSDQEKRAALEQIAMRMAADVAGNFDPRVYRLAEHVVPRLLTAAMNPKALGKSVLSPHDRISKLLTVEGEVELLQRIAPNTTLVFVPTHSSNLDSIVLGYALQRYDLPPCVYGAGKNLFTNPLISFFMHNLGAYRVDRRVRAALYKEVLKTYSTVMLERGYHSLFFPGGTRSRSGLIEPKLKLGLAGTAIEAFSRNVVKGITRPVLFVPTTINYALVLEAETLIEDYLKEQGRARYIIEDDEFSRVDRWIDFFQKLLSMTAACIIRFGRPIDPFGNTVDDDGRSLTPRGHSVDPTTYVSRRGVPTIDEARDRAYTAELGDVLVDRYRRDTVLMSTQVVAHVLYRRLVRSTPGVDVFGRIRHRGDVSMSRDELVREVGEVRDRLVGLEGAGRVRVSPYVRTEPPAAIVDRALKAFSGYHSRPVALEVGAEITAEDPTLLLYYQNRLVPFATEVAGAGDTQAAREIESMELLA